MSRLSVGNDGKMIILAGTYQLGAAIAAADEICAQRVEFDRATAEGAAQCDDENKKEALDCSNHEPYHRTKHTIWSTLRGNKRGRVGKGTKEESGVKSSLSTFRGLLAF